MTAKKKMNPYLRRLLVILFASTATIFVISEIAFVVMGEDTNRAPKRIELEIPLGTAARVAAGEEVEGIPSEMTFVLGDELVVRNFDVSAHELGPIFVPPGTTGVLPLDEVARFSLSCSFRPSQYLGLDVREATTIYTRLLALFVAAPATAAVIFLYSLAVRPVESVEDRPATKQG